MKLNLNEIDNTIIKFGIKMFRCSVVIITSIAILAVDFKIFPKHNAKTESFGFGLMDVGVGYFIMCHSMRLIRNSSHSSKEDTTNVTYKQ